MAEIAPRTTHGLGRRGLLKNGLLAGLGVAVVGVGSSELMGTAWAETEPATPVSTPTASVVLSTQTYWHWCVACDSLFFSNSAGRGFRILRRASHEQPCGSGLSPA